MRTALISDVHANLGALQAVLAQIKKIGVDRIFCLGDTVGYGPQPRECLEIVRHECAVILMGNHEYAVLNGALDFTSLAAEALDWTASRLRDQHLLSYLQTLPMNYQEGEQLFVHGSIYDPINDYVREAESPMMFNRLLKTLREDFSGFSWCFVGHNHRTFLGTNLGYIFPHDRDEHPQTAFNLFDENAYISIGSVGQPRDGDYRASWVLLENSTVTFHRVEYDWRQTAELIKATTLPRFLARRLSIGE